MIQKLSEIKYKCNDCVHEGVCKYKEEYKKIALEILNNTIPEYFTININCKNFSSNGNNLPTYRSADAVKGHCDKNTTDEIYS